MKNKVSVIKLVSSLLLVFNTPVFSQEIKKIDFYGVLSPDADKNMIKMTEDLFYTQLSELSIELKDSRSPEFSNPETYIFESTTDPSQYAMYVTINKLPTLKWECNINLKKLASGKTFISKKEYDSYYKILMESKINLNSILTNLLDSTKASSEKESDFLQENEKIVSTDTIAGSWTGEDYIDKIMIMRGGRGFIIYKNGASMNISVSLEITENNDSVINILQTSRNNASFYPELPRKVAMEYAIEAKPIQWNLTLTKNNTLKGVKNTLILKSPELPPEEGKQQVEWSKAEQLHF